MYDVHCSEGTWDMTSVLVWQRSVTSPSVVMMTLCNQPEAFALDLSDNHSHYLLSSTITSDLDWSLRSFQLLQPFPVQYCGKCHSFLFGDLTITTHLQMTSVQSWYSSITIHCREWLSAHCRVHFAFVPFCYVHVLLMCRFANVFMHKVNEDIAPGYHSIVHRLVRKNAQYLQ